MKHKSPLYRLVEEKDKQSERLDARLRKRRQRQRDDAETQVNPFANILVVRNKMNGEILIIDRESYTPKYHEILISPDQMDQTSVKAIIRDPKFVQTETSKRLFGDVKQDGSSGGEGKSVKTASETSGGSEGGDGGEDQPSIAPAPPAPVREIPFTKANVTSGPMIALGMMGGMQAKDLQKNGITPEQLDEYNSSQEIQQISNQIAQQIGFYFKELVGRDILEYIPIITEGQMFQTTNFWKSMGGYDSGPKTNIAFRHKCVIESMKDKECQKTMCACTEAGIVPSEQMVTFTIKYGSSSLTNGKLLNDGNTNLFATINIVDMLLAGNAPQDLMMSLNQKEKHDLEKLNSDVEFLKKIALEAVNDKIIKNVSYQPSQEDKLEELKKLSETMKEKIERVINSNILYFTLFLNEALTGYSKFGKGSPGYAQGIIAIVPEEYNLTVEMLDMDFTRKIIDSDINMSIHFKNQIEETPDEKAELEACKIRFGGKCPKLVNPQKYGIRNYIKLLLKEERFTYSPLSVLFEQVDVDQANSMFLQMIESVKGIQDLMNIFAIQPTQITIQPIDFYAITAIDYSSERNIVKVNGKRFEIPVQIPTVLPDDSESVLESKSMIKMLVEKRKKRNYRKEYDEYHGTAEQRANRSKRVLARRKMIKAGKVKKGDGKDVDHKNGNPQDNSMSNLRARSKHDNRGDH